MAQSVGALNANVDLGVLEAHCQTWGRYLEQKELIAMIAVSCGCGKNFKAKPEYAGRRVKCPQCKDPIRIPMAEDANKRKMAAANPKASKSRAAAKADPMDQLLDDVGILKAGSAGTCPKCKEPLQPEAVLCVKCGFRLDGGKQLDTKSLIRQQKGVGRAHLGSEIRSDLPKSLYKLISTSKIAGLILSLLAAAGVSLAIVMATVPEVATQIQSKVSFLNLATLSGLSFIALISGLLSFFVYKQAKQGKPAARSAGFLASLLMLLVVPVGTVLGLMMLMPLIHPDTKRFYR